MRKLQTFVIAEAGINHNGREDLALKLIDAAADCGASAVKFQTFSAERLVRKGAPAAAYQRANTGIADQFALLKSLELSQASHEKLARRCEVAGIEFMSTPFDVESADFLRGLGMGRFKIPSGEITNEPFLAHLAAFDRPLILSTGMADMSEIERAVEVIDVARANSGLAAAQDRDLSILHCTSNYPAALADVNLLAMRAIAETTGRTVGYSDHTAGILIAPVAVALGAKIIEKHFTLDRDMAGPDHKASLTVPELRAMIEAIIGTEKALGSGIKEPTPSEEPVRKLVRRSLTTARDVAAGEVLTRSDIVLLRPGDGIPPRELDKVVGLRTRHPVAAGTTLTWRDLE